MALCGLVAVLAVTASAVQRSVYVIGGGHVAEATIAPRVIELDERFSAGSAGGLIAADLDGDRARDFIVTATGYIGAFGAAGERLWSKAVDIQVTAQAESEGLPGLHAPGVQVADIDGDGATEVLLLTRDGRLLILDGRSGAERRSIRLPVPAGAERWEHLVVANFRGRGDRDLLLQATNAEGYRMGRFLAAYAMDELMRDGESAALLWARDDFVGNAHSGARIADLDGDGRHEVLGGDIIGPDGGRLFRLPLEGHLDSTFVADVRPDLPGLEVVSLEEGGPQRVFLYNHRGLIWQTNHHRQEPQNAALGDFDPDRPGLEIWCRSRYPRDQKPWLLDAQGELISEYEMAEVAPAGWTVSGVEVISSIAWTAAPKALAAAKERHEAGDVAIFDPLTGAFELRIEEQAERLYVADVTGDWREEILVINGKELHIYQNSANPGPEHSRLWSLDHYRRSKLTWNYYNP